MHTKVCILHVCRNSYLSHLTYFKWSRLFAFQKPGFADGFEGSIACTLYCPLVFTLNDVRYNAGSSANIHVVCPSPDVVDLESHTRATLKSKPAYVGHHNKRFGVNEGQGKVT